MSAASHLRLVETRALVDENGEIVSSCPHCAAAASEAETWERRVLELERKLRTALEDKDAKMARDKDFPAAIGLIQEWKRECGHPNSSETDPKRIRLALSVVKRYKGDEGRAKLSMVIQQGKHLAYRDPDTGFKYDEFSRLFGSADEIEARATKWWLHCRRRGLDPNGRAA